MHQPPHLRFRAFEELPFIVYEDVMGLPRVVDYSTCPPLNEPRQLNPPPHTEERMRGAQAGRLERSVRTQRRLRPRSPRSRPSSRRTAIWRC